MYTLRLPFFTRLARSDDSRKYQDQLLPSRPRIGLPMTSPSTKPSAASCITAIGKTPRDLHDRCQLLPSHVRRP